MIDKWDLRSWLNSWKDLTLNHITFSIIGVWSSRVDPSLEYFNTHRSIRNSDIPAVIMYETHFSFASVGFILTNTIIWCTKSTLCSYDK